MGPGTIAVAEGGEYAGGALFSPGDDRLVVAVVMEGLAGAICLVVEVDRGACFCDPNDEVLREADVRLALGSLLEPNFLKNEGILFDEQFVVGERVRVAMLLFVCGDAQMRLSRQAQVR